ncbi:MAG: 50S ribosomal protein L25/general stress protein Ctc [Actinomycetales bacterium]|nr:50S ribosomal protein L25/general stress protein Ctc [Actinomycetales bacterium]
MTALKLAATTRTEFGKGAARRIRRAQQIPAVLYGHGAAPLHISLPGHDTMLALKHTNALLTIEVDGKEHLAIARDVQRDPVRNVIEHVDLLAVRKGEKINVTVPVRVVGESAPGTIHFVEAAQGLNVQAEATALPEVIEVSIEGLEAGTVVRGADLVLPEGVTLLDDPEEAVLSISLPQAEAAAEEEAEEAEESAAAAAPAEAEAPAEEA